MIETRAGSGRSASARLTPPPIRLPDGIAQQRGRVGDELQSGDRHPEPPERQWLLCAEHHESRRNHRGGDDAAVDRRAARAADRIVGEEPEQSPSRSGRRRAKARAASARPRSRPRRSRRVSRARGERLICTTRSARSAIPASNAICDETADSRDDLPAWAAGAVEQPGRTASQREIEFPHDDALASEQTNSDCLVGGEHASDEQKCAAADQQLSRSVRDRPRKRRRTEPPPS